MPLTESERTKVAELNQIGRQVTFEKFPSIKPETRWCCSCVRLLHTRNGWGASPILPPT